MNGNLDGKPAKVAKISLRDKKLLAGAATLRVRCGWLHGFNPVPFVESQPLAWRDRSRGRRASPQPNRLLLPPRMSLAWQGGNDSTRVRQADFTSRASSRRSPP